MAKTSPSIFRRLIPGFIFGFIVIIALALIGDLNQVSQQVLNFDWRLYPLVIAFTLVNYGLRFLKFRFYLGRVGVHSLRWTRILRIFIAGYPLGITPGKVGEVFKGIWLKRLANLPLGKGISVILAERISDGIAVLALSTLGVVEYPRYWPVFLFVLIILAIFIILSQVRPFALRVLTFVERLPVISRFSHSLHEFYEGSYSLFRPRTTLIGVTLGAISWFWEGIGFYIILLGLGQQPGLRLASLAVFILAFSMVIGAASTLPAGLGAAEASIAGMLAFIVGMDAPAASAATLLIRLATLWFGVTLGLITWIFSADLLGLRETNNPNSED